ERVELREALACLPLAPGAGEPPGVETPHSRPLLHQLDGALEGPEALVRRAQTEARDPETSVAEEVVGAKLQSPTREIALGLVLPGAVGQDAGERGGAPRQRADLAAAGERGARRGQPAGQREEAPAPYV